MTLAVNTDNKPAQLVSGYSLERTEASMLACLLIDNDSWWVNADGLNEGLFSSRKNKLIFKAVSALINSGEPADIVTVGEYVERQWQESLTQYIAESILEIPVVIANASNYLERLRAQQMERLMSSVSLDLSKIAARSDLSVSEKLSEFTGAVTKISQEVVTVKAKDGGEMMNELVEYMERRIAAGGEIGGVPSGFHDLDLATDGLHAGDLIVIAGRPSMGKTTLAMNMVESVAVAQGLPVFVASLEMPAYKLSMRMASSLGSIASDRLRRGNLDDAEWGKFREVGNKIKQSPILVTDNFNMTATDIRASAARFRVDNGGKIGAIVIDYLQLMKPEKGTENRNETERLGETSRQLKGLAKDMECPVIVLSQLNRSLEMRPDKRPMMSDLRSSGAIEQDADLILFVYRDEVYNDDSPYKGYGEIIIGKQRDGELATVFTKFEGRYSRFVSLGPGEIQDVNRMIAQEERGE